MNHLLKPVTWVMALACLALFSASAQASEVFFSSTIKAVYPQADGSFVLKFNQNSSSCLNTGNPQAFFVSQNQNGVTEAGLKNLLATSLTAYATQSPVVIAFDISTTSCYISRISMGE